MTRVTLLIAISIFTSTICWILLSTEWLFKEQSRFVTYLYDTFVAFDAMINVLCMYLSFLFGIKLYEKFLVNCMENWMTGSLHRQITKVTIFNWLLLISWPCIVYIYLSNFFRAFLYCWPYLFICCLNWLPNAICNYKFFCCLYM